MSNETPSSAVSPWPTLTALQRRVLGVLVEKAKTTPEVYPMSLNAITNGCNQKSNRDPVMNLLEEDVDEVLTSCQQKGLTTKVVGGRVLRWRHNLYDQWKLEKVEAAIVTELLLRGPQTEGELRTRASRMEPIDDLETLRARLSELEERKLVVYLGPRDRRGVLVTHGFHTPAELQSARNRMPAEEPVSTVVSAGRTEEQPSAQRELAVLKEQMAQLQSQVDQLGQQLASLKEALGVA